MLVLNAHTTAYTAPSFVEDAEQYQRSFDTETAHAVTAIRQSYDPDGLFGGDVVAGSTRALTVIPEQAADPSHDERN